MVLYIHYPPSPIEKVYQADQELIDHTKKVKLDPQLQGKDHALLDVTTN